MWCLFTLWIFIFAIMNPRNLKHISIDYTNGLKNEVKGGLKYSRSDLFAIRDNVFHRSEFRKLSPQTETIIKTLGIKKKRKRGSRGGSKQMIHHHSNMRNIKIIETSTKRVHKSNDTLKFCLLNPWSVCNKADEINDFIVDQGLDLLAITETWLSGDITDNPIISALSPAGYSVLQNPRKTRGGGTAVVYRDTMKLRVSSTPPYETFELLECTFMSSVLVRLCIIYRPPGLSVPSFLNDFADYMSHVLTAPGHPLIVGDFNIHIGSSNYAAEFTALCTSLNLNQHVLGPTHRNGHTLDLVLTRSDDSMVRSAVSCDHGFPDHFPVFANLLLEKPKLPTVQVSYRKIKSITANALSEAIKKSTIWECDMNDLSTDELSIVYNNQLRTILEDLAPIKTRQVPVRPEAEWYSQHIREAKQVRCRAERAWRKSGLEVNRLIYLEKRNHVNSLIKETKTKFYKDLIHTNKSDTKQLFKVVNKLLRKDIQSPLPSGSDSVVADMFSTDSNYFIEKISDIRDSIPAHVTSINNDIQTAPADLLDNFRPLAEEAVEKIIASSPSKSCDLDPIPTQLVKLVLPQLLPVITTIINKSLETGIFPSEFKQAIVTPLLKKSSLDPEVLKNFRPVSNLSFVSKILEKVVARQLNEHLVLNNFMEPFQSAYRAGHSTESALLRIQNDIINML